jgi:hypothetical protein
MNRVTLSFIIVLICLISSAQIPQKMSYQAVIRDAGNVLVTNQTVGMRVSILKGSESGTAVYVETQTSTTNSNGMVTIEIGGGTIVTGTFAGIDWSTGTYFIKTETDPAGGTSYTITATSQLLSVPYALFAMRVGEHYIGELFGGGIIFYVDPTGSHGLICSMLNLNGIWSQYPNNVGAGSHWEGQENTNKIIDQLFYDTLSAAMICHKYVNAVYGTGIYSDWFLPAIDELAFIYKVIYELNKTLKKYGIDEYNYVRGSYWSSTESEMNMAAEYFYMTEGKILLAGKNIECFIRPIRAF